MKRILIIIVLLVVTVGLCGCSTPTVEELLAETYYDWEPDDGWTFYLDGKTYLVDEERHFGIQDLDLELLPGLYSISRNEELKTGQIQTSNSGYYGLISAKYPELLILIPRRIRQGILGDEARPFAIFLVEQVQ